MAGVPGTFTAAGTAIAICASAPATQDKAGYAALTFVEIGNVDKIGTIGATTGKVEFTPLKGPKQKLKGSTDYGSLQPSYGIDNNDAGQALMQAAAAPTAGNYAFKVTYVTGDVRYFMAIVFGSPEDVQGAETVVMGNPVVEINSVIVKVPAGS